jgi:AcrR family transcriptional regulator
VADNSAERAPRRLRADAARNIDSLLEAAKAVFATSGVDAPAKEIADLAGVGVGTLYRHFPQRSDLVKAVFQREVDACADAAPALAAAHEPAAAVPRDQAGARRRPALGRPGLRRAAGLLHGAAGTRSRITARGGGGQRRDQGRHQPAGTPARRGHAVHARPGRRRRLQPAHGGAAHGRAALRRGGDSAWLLTGGATVRSDERF